MADSSAIISSSGGIAAGTPFALGHYLYVQQVSPPVAASGRLDQLADAFQSITAVGSLGAPHTFVVGEDAEDAIGGDRSVLVGYKLRQNSGGAGQAVDQVLIGNTIQLPAAGTNSQGVIAIGAAHVFNSFPAAAANGNSVAIGANVTWQAINAGGGDADDLVVIGASATGYGGGVIIGNNASASDLTAVAIGQNATAGLQAVAIGLNSIATAARCISIGDRARAGSADTIVIGWFADGANSDSSIVIGKQANSNAKTANIMLGRNASVALDYFMQIGGDQTYPINEIRFGAGYTQATGGLTYTFGITTVFGGAGNNLAGNDLSIRSGLGTGNWPNTQDLGITFYCGLVQGAGSTQQPYSIVLKLRHSDLNVAWWQGGAGPATYGGGKQVMFIGNAATVPTVAPTGGCLLYVDPATGFVHILSANGVDTVIAF